MKRLVLADCTYFGGDQGMTKYVESDSRKTYFILLDDPVAFARDDLLQ